MTKAKMNDSRGPGRPLGSYVGQPKTDGKSPIVQRVRMGHGSYVQRYVKCGPRCSRCESTGLGYDPRRPGHGPYWYFETKIGGRVNRRYVGRELKVIERDLSGGSVIVAQGEMVDPDGAAVE